MTLPHVLLAVAVTVVWGMNFVFIAMGLEELPPVFFAFLRYLLAAVPLVFFLARPRCDFRWVAAYGVFQFALQFTLLFAGIRLGMPAGLASLVVQLQAFFTMLLALPLLHERPHRMQWAGAALAFAGVAAIGSHLPGEVPAAGLLLVLGAGLSWACGNLLVKRMGQVDAGGLVAWGSLAALPVLAVASLALEGWPAIVTAVTGAGPRAVTAVLVNAWAATLFGFGGWSWLMRRHPAATIAPFSLLVPVTGMGGAVLFLGERPGAWAAAAAVLVVAGLALNLVGARRRLAGR